MGFAFLSLVSRSTRHDLSVKKNIHTFGITTAFGCVCACGGNQDAEKFFPTTNQTACSFEMSQP